MFSVSGTPEVNIMATAANLLCSRRIACSDVIHLQNMFRSLLRVGKAYYGKALNDKTASAIVF